MPRIKLAYWHGDKQPGDEIDVTADELAALRRDGRVAEVLDDPPPAAQPASEPQPEPEPEVAEEPAESAPSGRKRR